jgi:hypothetical protein
MIPKSYAEKHFRSSNERLLEAVLDRFLKENIPHLGPELRVLLGRRLIELFEQNMLTEKRVKPGQMLWIAVDKNTRADSKKVKYISTILTLVTKEEINDLVNGSSCGLPNRLLPQTISRLCKEAYSQGALLSMRDIALIFKRSSMNISSMRKKIEEQNGETLPTPATLQDMGSGVTHKALILRKVLIEKKDMDKVRAETFHTQHAIDRYLKEFRRVEILLKDDKPVEYISKVTKIRPFIVTQYQKIYEEVKKY